MTQSLEPKILVIDGMNFIHRSRAGMLIGDNPIVFNFFRSFRAIVDQFKPTRVYFILDGHAKRKDTTPDYKANRIIQDEEKLREMQNVWRQKDIILKLLAHLPVSVMCHPNHEADDLIYNLLLRSVQKTIPWIVASSDSDFTQLLHSFPHVQLYNPIKKEFVQEPEYDYVTWKALRGDASDNIKGIPGVGDKTATMLATNFENLTKFLEIEEHAKVFLRNAALIEFITFSDDELNEVLSSQPTFNAIELKKEFESYAFNSITNDKSWKKFVDTFSVLEQ